MAAEVGTDVVRAEGFGLGEMVPALDQAGRGFVDLLRSLDPQDGERPIPGMTWTVAEVAVHMLTIVRRGLGDRRRADSVDGLAALNDQTIAELNERDVRILADLIEADMRQYVDLLRGTSDELIASRVVVLHAGVRTDIPTALSYQLFDFLAHGWDIAVPTERTWVIDDEHGVVVLRAGLPALRPWVLDDILEGPTRRAAFTFPGFAACLVVETGAGTYEVHPAGRELAEAAVDPVEMFLAVAGRLESEDPYIKGFASIYRPI